MIITKNSCDLNHRGVEIESQNKSIFKHFGAPTSREVHNTLAPLPSVGELSWVSVISGLDSGLEGWNWLRNIIVFRNNTHLCCVAAYKLDYGSALYWPAFMSQACTIFSCMKITYTASDKKLGGGLETRLHLCMHPWSLKGQKSHAIIISMNWCSLTSSEGGSWTHRFWTWILKELNDVFYMGPGQLLHSPRPTVT